MPYSYKYFKGDVQSHFKSKVNTDVKILDVGPGCGTYADLLKDSGFKMDCLEIWEPYVHQFNLSEKYENVILGNIVDFDFTGYDYIIMGDILEHLTVADAQEIMRKIEANNIKTLVAVPYEYEQGERDGNVYETHLQPELTPELMNSQYPTLKLFVGDDQYGYYINY
mgnify:CR=1 FL=1